MFEFYTYLILSFILYCAKFNPDVLLISSFLHIWSRFVQHVATSVPGKTSRYCTGTCRPAIYFWVGPLTFLDVWPPKHCVCWPCLGFSALAQALTSATNAITPSLLSSRPGRTNRRRLRVTSVQWMEALLWRVTAGNAQFSYSTAFLPVW